MGLRRSVSVCASLEESASFNLTFAYIKSAITQFILLACAR